LSLAFSWQIYCCTSKERTNWRVKVSEIASVTSGNDLVKECSMEFKDYDFTCAVKRRWSTVGESPARELGSLHPEAIGAAVEETKPSEPPM
jgi:hypothetical protein